MIKIGLAYYLANWKRSVLGAMLLAVILLLILYFGAIVGYERSKMNFLEPLQGKRGGYLEVSDTLVSIMEGNTARLQGVEKEITVRQGSGIAEIKRNEKTINENCVILEYPELIYEGFSPLITAGEWLNALDDNSIEEGIIPVVVTADRYDLNIGEIYSIKGNEKAYKVVGKIRDGADIFWAGNSYSYINKDYRAYYEEAYLDRNEYLIMMMREQDAESVNLASGSKSIVVYDDDIEDKILEENEKVYRQIGHFVDMDDFITNSKNEVYKYLKTYIPIGMMIFIVVSITLLSMAVVDYRSSLDFIGIYHVCGMSKLDYLKLIIFHRVWASLSASLLVICIYWIIRAGVGVTIYTRVYGFSICSMAGALIIFNGIYIVTSLLVYFRNSPADAIKQRGRLV